MAERTGNPAASLAGGAVLGGLCGGLIGSTLPGGWWPGLLLGAVYLGAAETITDLRRRPGQIKPLPHRIVSSTLLGGAAGALLGGLGPLAVGLLIGLATGLLALGPRPLALALLLGLGWGLTGRFVDPLQNPALIGAATVFSYRILAPLLFRGRAVLTLSGERLAPDQVRYVVPFVTRDNFVGADYLRRLAAQEAAPFAHNPTDIGLVDSLDELAGPTFDPGAVAPLIREFYEHTTRFKLTIVPDWNVFIRPAFWLFKATVARPLGQANLPFNTREAQRGIQSSIDTIELPDPHDPAGASRRFRAWVRAFAADDGAASGEAIYVGIYTVIRHEGRGFISVGFPLPAGNFSATLAPYNRPAGGLLLKTAATGTGFTGHYLSASEADGALTTLKLPTMNEEIEVYREEGALRTDHRFYFGGYRFLTLFYTIKRV